LAAPLLIGLSLLDECRRYCKRALSFIDETSSDARAEMILQEAMALPQCSPVSTPTMSAQQLNEDLCWLRI
jgi:hypothetical protein